MRMLVLTLLTFKKVKLIFGHPVYKSNTILAMEIHKELYFEKAAKTVFWTPFLNKSKKMFLDKKLHKFAKAIYVV